MLLSFDGLRGPDGKVRVFVWDRICTVTGKPDRKDGMETEFTVETMSQMIDNFVDRGDLIPMDHGHQTNYAAQNGQPAPALAWYGALAVVDAGKVVKAGAARGVAPQGIEGLDLSRDGLYGYRTEVTEIGEQYLPSFKYLSPTFTPAGTRRDGSECGYALLAVAATNSPFQEGTQITFSKEVSMANEGECPDCHGHFPLESSGRLPKHTEDDRSPQVCRGSGKDPIRRFDSGAASAAALETPAGAPPEPGKESPPMKLSAEMLAKLGLGEDASPEECFAALQRHFEAAEEEKAAKMAADEEAAKMAADAAEMAKLEADKDDDKKDAKMAAMQATLQATAAKLAKLEAREAERAKAEEREREAKYEALADQAIAGGYAKEKRAALIKFARVDFEGARATVEHLLPKGGAPSHLFDRVSKHGGPASPGAESSARETAIGAPKPEVVHALGREFRANDSAFAAEVRKVAESTDPTTKAKVDRLLPAEKREIKFERLIAANRVVRAERPDLVAAGE